MSGIDRQRDLWRYLQSDCREPSQSRQDIETETKNILRKIQTQAGIPIRSVDAIASEVRQSDKATWNFTRQAPLHSSELYRRLQPVRTPL